MQAYKIDPLRDPRWTEFVRRHPRSSVFHTREWLDSLRRTHGYEPVVFTTSTPAEKLMNGLVFCCVQSWLTGNRMVSLPFSDHCELLVDSIEDLQFLLAYIRAEIQRRDWKYVENRPISERFAKQEQAAGFCTASKFYLHRLDLRPSLEEIFQGLKNSAQRRIKRAAAAGISLTCGRADEMFRDFYGLLVTTWKRHRLPPQPYAWFRNLRDCMREALEIRLAYKGGLPIAALLLLRFKSTTYYKYGCSDAKFHSLGAMPALLWRTIEESKAAGSLELDLGRSELKNHGLITFKDHWTRECIDLVYRRYPAWDHMHVKDGSGTMIVKSVFAHMPEELLAFVGRMIYRHMA